MWLWAVLGDIALFIPHHHFRTMIASCDSSVPLSPFLQASDLQLYFLPITLCFAGLMRLWPNWTRLSCNLMHINWYNLACGMIMWCMSIPLIWGVLIIWHLLCRPTVHLDVPASRAHYSCMHACCTCILGGHDHTNFAGRCPVCITVHDGLWKHVTYTIPTVQLQ